MPLPPLPKKGGSTPSLPKASGGGSTLPPLPKKAGTLPSTGKAVTSGKKGGGFLSDAFHAVTGLGGGLGRVALGLAKELKPDAPWTPFTKGVGKERYGPDYTPGWHNLKEQKPILAELVTSPARTLRELPDTAVSLVPGHGGFGQSMLGQEIKQHGYLSTGLAKAADVMTLASAGGGALAKAGFGGLAEAAKLEDVAAATAKAAKLSKGATAADLSEAATKAAAAGDVAKATDLAKAADQLTEANRLRSVVAEGGKASQIAAKTAEVSRDVARMGGHIANAPAKPYELLAEKVAAPVLKGVTKFAVEHSDAAARAAEAVQQAAERHSNKRTLSDLHYENVTAPEHAGQFRVREMGGVADLSKNLEPTEQAALTVIRSKEGLDPAVRAAYDKLTPEHQAAFVQEMFRDERVTPEAFQMAKAYEDGTLPAEQTAKLTDAAKTLNDAIYSEHGRRYVEGTATKQQLSEAGLAERAAQAGGGGPVPQKVARLTEQFQAAPKARLASIEDEAAAIRQRNLEPQTGTLSEAAKRQVSKDEGSLAVRKSIARQLRKGDRAGASTAERAAGRSEAAISERADRLQREANRRVVRNDENRLATLDERKASYVKKLDDAVTKAEDDVRAAPAQDRPALEVNKRAQTFVRDIAKEYPAEAGQFSALADDIATTTRDLHAKGLHPEYTFGGEDAVKSGPVVGVGPKATRKKLSSEMARKSGHLKRTVAGEVESFERETHTLLQNKAGAIIQEQLGSTGRKVLTEAGYSALDLRAMGPAEIEKALADEHAVAWHPTGSGGKAATEAITLDTPVIPDYLHKQLSKYTAAADKGATGFKLLKTYDKATGKLKHTVLALSPKWHAGNVMGNSIMASIGAGVTPARMMATLPEARRVIKAVTEGRMDDPGVVRLLSSGFHAEDLAQLSEAAGKGNVVTNSLPGRALSRVISKSYAMNEAVDNIGRTIVYLAKKDSGVSSEAAVQMSLKAMGDFSKMSPLERNVVRRVVPFYAWQRHITKLAFSLPLEAPARVAWTLHMADLGNQLNGSPGDDDPFNRNSVKIGSGRLSLDQFNPFGSSFFVDPSLQGAGYQINPILKGAVVAATGLSPNRGFKPLRTPEAQFGAGPQGAYGLKNPVRVGQYLGQQIPQVKALQDLLAGDAAVRFETGQPDKKHTTGRGTLAQVAKLLGIPIPTPDQPQNAPKTKVKGRKG